MTGQGQNRQITLAARPVGEPKTSDFALKTAPIPVPGPGEALLRTVYLSLDPYMRGRMSAAKSYAKPVEIGEVMVGGRRLRGRRARAIPVCKQAPRAGLCRGWQDYAVAEASALRKLDPAAGSALSTALGVLGMPGMTAYTGLLTIGQPKPGETVVVAAATGPVGSAVGQIAQHQGLPGGRHRGRPGKVPRPDRGVRLRRGASTTARPTSRNSSRQPVRTGSTSISRTWAARSGTRCSRC